MIARLLLPYFKIIRPVNVMITMLSVTVVMYVAIHDPTQAWIMPALMAAVSAGLICAGANVINDYYDLEIDRINKPQRPLVTGSIKKNFAVLYWIFLSATGIAVNFWLNQYCLIIATGTAVVLWIYSRWLKKTALWGNLTVSIVTGLTFVYAGAALQEWRPFLMPAVFAFFIHLAREILKDIEDASGDRSQNARTFPIVYGTTPSVVLITGALVLLILATLLAYFLNYYRLPFLLIIATGIYPLLGYIIYTIWKKISLPPWKRISRLLKLCMVIGLIAIYFG